jgi:hypothetical protein
MTRRNWSAAAAAAWMCALLFAAPAHAQIFMGRIDATIEDAGGAPIPAAQVDLTSGHILGQVTDIQGQVHFLNLPAGLYAVRVSAPGSTTSATSGLLTVLAGTSTRLVLRMPAPVVPPAAGTPPVVPPEAGKGMVTASSGDVMRMTTTTHVDLEPLQEIPSGRDPWVVLQTVPTIYVDRVDVGSSAAAEQSNFYGKGAIATDNTWNLDGVPVTDMGDNLLPPALVSGSLGTYYDFDSVQEIAVTTGGAEVQNATAGVGVNLVLKSGFNTPTGNMRANYENDWLQAVNISPALAQSLGNTAERGNRIDEYFDRGVDIGGPIFRNQLWVWGTAAYTKLHLTTLQGYPDNTDFTNYSLKFDGRATDDIRGNFTYYYNNREEEGRGASALRPPATTWNQAAPTSFYKGEGRFVVGNNFFASARIAVFHGGFDLEPVGTLLQTYYFDAGLVAQNSFYAYRSDRPQRYAGGDGNYLMGNNQIKFGGAWRSTPVDTQQIFPGNHLIATWSGYPNMYVQAARDYRAVTDASYLNMFVSDTISLNRLTLTGGVRLDYQNSSLGASSVPGVDGVALLPALSAPAVGNVLSWTNLTPRVGLTFAIDESRKTIVRASYAMFASQLPGTEAAFVSPIQHSYAYYNAIDRNSDGAAQIGEVLFSQGLQGYSGFDPANPSKLASVNTVDPNVKAPMTRELMAAFDRQVTANTSVSAGVTYRRMTDLLWAPLTGVTSANYTQTGVLGGTLPEGAGPYSVPVYALNASAVPSGGGETLTNRQGYHQQYFGIEASATKRLSNRWAAHVGFSTNNWSEYFDDPSKSILDPTPAPAPSLNRPFAGPQVAGGAIASLSSGTGQSSVYMVAPGYQLDANGTVQIKWDISLTGSMLLRQGYAEPFYASNISTGDPLGKKTVILVPAVDTVRLPSVTTLDGRAEKRFKFGKSILAADFDVFNILNSATVLGKQYDASTSNYDQTLEIMNPRIIRIGVRYFF